MNPQSLNLFIINSDPDAVRKIRRHLAGQFGDILNISTFRTGRTALKELDKNTRIVIIDDHLDGENGAEVQKSIKLKNPDTEVILLSANENEEEITIAINNYCEVVPGAPRKSALWWRKVVRRLQKIVNYPVYLLVREFGVSKFVAIFLLTWTTIGVIVIIAFGLYLAR